MCVWGGGGKAAPLQHMKCMPPAAVELADPCRSSAAHTYSELFLLLWSTCAQPLLLGLCCSSHGGGG